MKSSNNLWQEFTSFKNIYNAFKNARKSNPNKRSVLLFSKNLEKEIFKIQKQLLENKYNPAPYKKFKIYEPKERLISAPAFKDVVIQHAIINIIDPIFEKTFIYNSFACRKNKGTYKGLSKLKKTIEFNKTLKYYLKQDVKKYFPSVDKNILKKIIKKRIKDKSLLSIILKIIDSYSFNNNKGIPIGNLTSQLFANIYLNELDQYVKHTLKVKYYYRYVDDFIILSNNKKQLKVYRRKINLFLNNHLKLNVPNNKKYINLVKNGVDFVGFKIYSYKINLRKTNVKRFLKRTKNKIILFKQRKLSLNHLECSICSFLGYLKQTNNYSLGFYLFSNFKEFSYLLDRFIINNLLFKNNTYK